MSSSASRAGSAAKAGAPTGKGVGGSPGAAGLAEGEPAERAKREQRKALPRDGRRLLVSGLCPSALGGGSGACAPRRAAGPSHLPGSGEEFGHKSL